MITQDQALKRLRIAAESETQAALARRLGISSQYLNDVLRGKREPAKILERFGLRRIVRYEEQT